MVDDIFLLTSIVVQRAVVLVPAVAWFFLYFLCCVVVFQDFVVVSSDDPVKWIPDETEAEVTFTETSSFKVPCVPTKILFNPFIIK